MKENVAATPMDAEVTLMRKATPGKKIAWRITAVNNLVDPPRYSDPVTTETVTAAVKRQGVTTYSG